MQRQKLSRNLTASIIAPTHSVSLTGEGWRCLHRESWDEKHHEFFGQTTVFYQNTMWGLTPRYQKRSKNLSYAASTDFWTLEAGPDMTPIGRITLQIMGDAYHQGLLFLDIDDNVTSIPQTLLGQMITYAFLTGELATLKILGLSPQARKAIQCLDPRFTTTVTTFSRNHLPDAKIQTLYQLEPDVWFDSTLGKTSLANLSWLKKRLERARTLAMSSERNKQKRHFIFSLLTLGKRRRR